MPTFEYQPLSGPSGAAVIDAPDRAAAVRLLRERGITPVRLEPVSPSGLTAARAAEAIADEAVPGASWAIRRAVSRTEMATFIRELATAVQAGLPLVPSLKIIARQSRSAGQQAMLAHLIERVEHGRSLAEAAADWGRPFNDLSVNLIRAGEASGRMEEVLEQAAALLERDVKLRRTLVAGLTYPVLLALLIAGAVIVIATYVVPTILEPVSRQVSRSQLPLPTRVLLSTTDFAGAYWWAIAGALVASALLFRATYADPAGRLSVDRGLLRVPVLGRVLRDVAVGRFARTFGTLVSAGLPALTALRLTKSTLGNRALEAVIEEAADQVAAGKTIAEPLERSGVFPPLLTQVIGLGERSGRLPQTLRQAADAFDARAETSIKLFTTVFPVVLVLAGAVVIAFVLMSVLLPLIQLQELIG